MILKKLKIKNFRQYFGQQEIEFATEDRNVTVINGNTGAGKTNMFLAINWCLYGSKGIIDKVGEIVNKQARLESPNSQMTYAEVELHFQHSDPDGTKASYVAWRTTRENEILHLSRVTPKGLEELPNPTLVLNTILPKNVRTYFLFDGEKIDEFAKPEHEDQVKKAVYGVLKLEVLKRAYEHLSAIGYDYERELKTMDTGSHIRDLLDKKEILRKDITEQTKVLENARKELSGALTLIEKLDEELSSQHAIQVDHLRRQTLEVLSHEIEEEIRTILDNIKSLGSSGYFLFGNSLVQKAISIIDEKRQKGEIPAGIREQFLRDLLERHLCICGRTITDESPEWQTLLGLMNQAMPSEIENKILETSGLLQGLRAKIEQSLDSLHHLKKRKAELDDQLGRILREADEISARLMGVGIQEVEALEAKRKGAVKKSGEFHVEIGSREQKIRDLVEGMKVLDQEIEKAEGLQGKAKLIQQKLTLTHESAKAVEEVYEEFAKKMRKDIEKETQNIFSQLIWKESQFTKVELTDDYRLTVLDRWESPARPELSAGERQLLSLSFIMALSGASDDSAPIVMDTPFGRLDIIPRENICRHLPKLADQLILFVTSTELQGKALEILKPHIGREYVLEWDKSTGCTTIIDKREGRHGT